MIVPYAYPEKRPSFNFAAALQDRGSNIEVTWKNVDTGPCLLNMGAIFGGMPIYSLKMSMSLAKMQDQAMSVAEGVAIEGRPDPWVIFMPPQSSYSVRIATNKIMLHRNGQSLRQLSGRWKLTITYIGKPALDYGPGGKQIPFRLSQNGPTAVPFCTGLASSEVARD